MASTSKTLLIFNEFFYPGYRGGGPIQSLTNLAVVLEDVFEIFVVTSSHDLHSANKYEGYIEDAFNAVLLPGAKRQIQVYYGEANTMVEDKIERLIRKVNPAIIYLNGMFPSAFFLFPLHAIRKIDASIKIVICPRGMLQQGALAVKPFKKRLYLMYLRLTGALKNAYWHATNEEEAADIKKYFSFNRGIVIASNIPKAPFRQITFPDKKVGELHLVYLSLIAEKKNLLLLLQLMQQTPATVHLDIYGPVTDQAYWKQCLSLIAKLGERVRYRGDVLPARVQEVISNYHALILLTKGENFGHALYESLSAGRPVITSYFTPWIELYKHKAGLNVPINNINECKAELEKFIQMPQEQYNLFCSGAHSLATTYYGRLDLAPYYKLFDVSK